MNDEELKEQRRIKRNAYHRKYYLNNKDKFNKHTLGKRIGERGRAKHLKYKLNILDENTKKPILSENFKSLREISEKLELSQSIVSMINRGKYQLGMGKTNKTKSYGKFKIERLNL
jgi:hypothetical protein